MMNDTSTPIALSALSRSQRLTDEIVVGKDIIELLAGAMYADPLTVYREYVQNAADAIEAARKAAAEFPAGAQVHIHLDHSERTVRIRDYGTGIPASEFARRLTAFGASQKRGAGLRGFRGVGRLAGLGYCQELVFRSRTNGSSKVHELRWDNRALREKLRDANYTGTLGDLVKEIATITTVPGVDFPERFFEVEMRKVVRIKNDLLMNEEEIRRYLSEVAPIPFAPDFTFAPRLKKWLNQNGISEPIEIELHDGKGMVYHRARNEVVSKSGVTAFHDVQCIPIQNSAGELLAIGWVLDHDYIGALPASSRLAGIRLRVGDIQVGDEQLLAPLFTEHRFASWAAGEFHVLHPRIVPNGRRDDFEHSAAYGELLDALKGLAKSLSQTIRDKSDDRRRRRRARLAISYARSWLAVAKEKNTHETIRLVAAEQVEAQLALVDKESAKVELDAELAKDLAQLRSGVKRVKATFEEPKPGRPVLGRSKAAVAAVTAILTSTTQIGRALPLAERVLTAMEATKTK